MRLKYCPAREVLPGPIMLLLAAADLEESQQNFEGMKAVYESYMGHTKKAKLRKQQWEKVQSLK